MEPSAPGVMWMYPEPVPTLRLAAPLTERVLWKVPSAGHKATWVSASMARAAQRSFMMLPPSVTYAGAEKAVPADANFIFAFLAKSLTSLNRLERGLSLNY